MAAATRMDEPSDPFEKLPEEVFQLIFLAVSDCKTLVRCMAVSRSFKEHSERVSRLSIVCPGQFTSYAEKLDRIYSMVRGFRCLEVLMVRVGQPKDEPPSWARCMRYAEIGSSVEKFIFMAAKSGEFSELDSALRDENRSEGQETRDSGLCAAEQVEEDDSSQAAAERCTDAGILDFNLRQVLAPSNDVLKRMVPVIVFAIVQGLDEFRDSVPDFIKRFRSLKTFLLVDMLESVTVFMREHQIHQMRSSYQQAESSGAQKGFEDVGAESHDSVITDADAEQAQMFKHDQDRESSNIQNGGSSDPRGKAVETAAEGCAESSSSTDRGKAGNTRSKGKELEAAHEENSSSQGCVQGESSSGFLSPRSDDGEEDEVTSPLRRPYADVVRGTPGPEVGEVRQNDAAGSRRAEGDERTSSDDGAEGWRYCRGICVHEAADGGDFVSKYRRNLKSRENRLMKVGGYRRRDRSTDWMDESVRRRQESRTYRGASYRRREESRANKDWRPEGGRRDGEDDSSSSSSSSSFPSPFSGVFPSLQRQEHVQNPFGLVSPRSCSEHNANDQRSSKDAPSSSTRDDMNQNEGIVSQNETSSSNHLSQNDKIASSSSSDKVNNSSESRSSGTSHLQSSRSDMEGSSSSSNHQSSSDKNGPGSSGSGAKEQSSSHSDQERTTDDRSNNYRLSDLNNNEVTSLEHERERQQRQQLFRWGRSDSEAESISSPTTTNNNNSRINMGDSFNGVGPAATSATAPSATAGFRGARTNQWRESWRETWGERLGRRARELRREMHSAAAMAAAEAEEGVRARQRLREGVRKRQMEIEREALRFDITFWRAESVVAPPSGYRLGDVSMCIATHGARSLAGDEVDALVSSALAGPLLAATIAHVNEQANFHNL